MTVFGHRGPNFTSRPEGWHSKEGFMGRVLVVLVALVAACVLGVASELFAQRAGFAYAVDDGGGGPFAAFLAWLNSPTSKTVLLLVGGVVLKKWGAFVNKAVPFALLVLSGLTQTLHTMFPDVSGPIQPAAYAVAAFSTRSGWGGFLFGSVVPVLMAVGIHSKSKNLSEWAKIGCAMFDPDEESGRGMVARR